MNSPELLICPRAGCIEEFNAQAELNRHAESDAQHLELHPYFDPTHPEPEAQTFHMGIRHMFGYQHLQDISGQDLAQETLRQYRITLQNREGIVAPASSGAPRVIATSY